MAWPKIKQNVRHLVNPYGFVILKRHDDIAVMRFPSRVVRGFPTNLWKPLKVDVEYVTPGIVYMVPWQTNDKVVQDSSRPFQLSSKPSQKMIQFAPFFRVKLLSWLQPIWELPIGELLTNCKPLTQDYNPAGTWFVFFGNLGISRFDRIFWLGLLAKPFCEPEETMVSTKTSHPCAFVLSFYRISCYLSSYNSRAYSKTWQLLLPHILQQKEAFLPLAVHLPTNAQVKEILKKHASIRAICHLDIKCWKVKRLTPASWGEGKTSPWMSVSQWN